MLNTLHMISTYAIMLIGTLGIILLACMMIELTWMVVKWTINQLLSHFRVTQDLIEWRKQKYGKKQ